MHPNVIQPQYNETGLPEMVDVWTQQASSPTALLDPGTANLHAVTNVSYNARGQRIKVDLESLASERIGSHNGGLAGVVRNRVERRGEAARSDAGVGRRDHRRTRNRSGKKTVVAGSDE